MWCSLNEIETEVRKAARGSGLSWGLAEEAGKAALWLEMHNIPSVLLFAELFEGNVARRYETIAPMIKHGFWHARGGRLCPIAAGAALSDFAAEVARQGSLTLRHVASPAILAPFVAAAAQAASAPLILRWPGVCFTFARHKVRLSTIGDHVADRSTASVSVQHSLTEESGTLLNQQVRRVAVDAAIWARLDVFAALTYVRASAASRLKGAGAGLLDND